MPALQQTNCWHIFDEVLSPVEAAARFKTEWIKRVHHLQDAPIAFASSSPDMLACAAAYFSQQPAADILLLPTERLSASVQERLLESGYQLVVDFELTSATHVQTAIAGRVSLLTSGTTGEPKLLPHRWDTLYTLQNSTQLEAMNWLVSYQPGAYAWYQLLTIGMFATNQSLIFPTDHDPTSMLAQAAISGVTAISATPTFWRFALTGNPPEVISKLSLKQISLGGEIVDQTILNTLRAQFPSSRITHIYASTEAGASIVVHDEKAGFPASWLDCERGNSPRLRVNDERLFIQSRKSSTAFDGWIDTGDVVEVRCDRVYFMGRAGSEMINVGGAKVLPRDVEATLLSHPSVHWCKVYGVKSAFTGSIVAADVVVSQQAESVTESELTRFCESKMTAVSIPRFWNFLSQIPITSSYKS